MVIIKTVCVNPTTTFKDLYEFGMAEYSYSPEIYDLYGLFIAKAIENGLLLDSKKEWFDADTQTYHLHLYSRSHENASEFLDACHKEEWFADSKNHMISLGWTITESIENVPIFSAGGQPKISAEWMPPGKGYY